MSAAFSPIMIDGALVLPDVSVGMIEASASRRPAMPRTRSWASTTGHRVGPHLAGAHRVVGGFCGLLHPVEDFVIGGPIGARREFAHLKGGHGGSGHDRAGDADR